MVLLLLLVPALAALVVAGLIIPFVQGLRTGPRPAAAGSLPADEPMRPLRSIADFYATVFVLAGIAAAWEAKDGFFGGGPKGAACVDTGLPNSSGGVQSWRAGPGTSLSTTGDVQACISHPTVGQWALFACTRLPGLLLWGCVLLVIIRLVGHAARSGPFTPRVARLIARLGWLIIAGCVVVGDLKGLGSSLLTDAVISPRPWDTGGVVGNALLEGPLRVLVPVPALAGVALLSFGRVTRAGAVMDEELQATV